MKESDAFDILKKEIPAQSESEGLNKPKKKLSKILPCLIGAICIVLILYLIYNIVVHPIDRLKAKIVVFDSYVITTRVQGSNAYTTVQVDGNLIYADGVYYELTDHEIYSYIKAENGQWYRYIAWNLSNNVDTSWVRAILDKSNYNKEQLFWKPLEYNGDQNILDLSNVRVQVLFHKCIISGVMDIDLGIINSQRYVTIEIGEFGWVKLKLPEEYTIVN